MMRSERPQEPDATATATPLPNPTATVERRLHPLSWLFVLLAQLREFAVPLIVLLVAGGRGGDRWQLLGALGALVLALIAVVQYFSYRFRIAGDELVIRSGILQRNLRHIPFRRIHNVTLHQNVLHRVFGVAEVRLESAGGAKPEAQMRVLALADARALEDLLRARGGEAQSVGPLAAQALAQPGERLLALPLSELLRLGLVSNRGMVALAAVFGALAQSGYGEIGKLTTNVGEALFGWASAQHLGWLGWMLGGVTLFFGMVLLLRMLSIALAVLQFFGFELRQSGQRLSIEAGLLTRVRTHAPHHRIQAWTVREGLLQRWLQRQSLQVDTANIAAANQPRPMRELAPIATAQKVASLLARLLPGANWPQLPWMPLHPRAWRRMLLPPSVLTVIVCALLCYRTGWAGASVLLALPWWWLRARRMAAFAAYALSDSVVAVRGGWPGHYWRLAEIDKLQVLSLSQTPFDRRHHMASVRLDTAGAHPMQPPLHIRYLPEPEARALLAALYARMQQPR